MGRGGFVEQVEGNPGLSFAEIVLRLTQRFGMDWRVEPDEAFIWDNRMVDPRLTATPITDQLPASAE